MANDKERNLQTLMKLEPQDDLTGEEATAAPMQSPFMDKTALHRDPVIGTSVSGYLVKGRLGSGGMGIVYEGEQQTIGKRVAIKVLRPEVAENPDVVERLVAEARAVNQVGHRGIIDVFAFGELPDGRQCIVMEYLDGESLDAILNTYVRERRVMPTGDVLVILDETLSALAAAHAAGVIHRDLKPSNIFLCKQRDGARYVKLLDFGIAKLGVLGNATPQSRASLMMGTPSYMAPEQAKGGNIGPAMDLYAVGIMAFEMFTGRLPFLADSVVAMLMAHQSEAPPVPSSFNLALPDGIDEMILKLLEKKPEDRFHSADAVRSLVVKLRKELADPTTQRVALEVTISARDRAAAVASVAAKAPRASAVMQTAVTPRTRAPQAPEQAAPTHEDLAPALKALDEAAPLDVPPRSNRGPIIGLLVVVVLLVIGIFAFTQAPEPKVEPLPAPVVVVKAEPPPVVKEELPVVAAPEPLPEAVVVEEAPPPEPVAVVARPLVPKAVQPKKSAKGGLTARVKKLEARLNKAVLEGGSVELYLKQVKKIQARLAEPGLTFDEKDRLESAVSRLEQSSDF